MDDELTPAEREFLARMDQEHQELLERTDPNRIVDRLLQDTPDFSPERLQSIIEESGIVDKIIALFKEESRKTDVAYLVRQAVNGTPLSQTDLAFLAAFIATATEYIRVALPQRLYLQVPLVLSEALSYASGEHRTTSEQQKLERLVSDRGRSPYLPLRDARGRKPVITDESLLRAFQEKGSSASVSAIAEALNVSPDALKAWRRNDSREFKSWKAVQQYFAKGEK